MMKYFSKALLFSLTVLLVISCGGDKEDPKPGDGLVGTWTGVSRVSTLTSNGRDFKDEVLRQLAGLDGVTPSWAAMLYNITFQAQQMARTQYYDEIEIKDDGTWLALPATVKSPGKWTLSSDKKTLTMSLDVNGLEMIGTITTMTSTDLVIEVHSDEDDDAGALITYDFNSTLKYKLK